MNWNRSSLLILEAEDRKHDPAGRRRQWKRNIRECLFFKYRPAGSEEILRSQPNDASADVTVPVLTLSANLFLTSVRSDSPIGRRVKSLRRKWVCNLIQSSASAVIQTETRPSDQLFPLQALKAAVLKPLIQNNNQDSELLLEQIHPIFHSN